MIEKIRSLVISLHLFLIVVLLFTPERTSIKKTHHVKVRYASPPPIQQPKVQARSASRGSSQAQQSPVAVKPTLPKPKPSSPVKQPVKSSLKVSPPPPTKVSPAKKPVVVKKNKPTPPSPQAEIWNEIDQALAKIEAKSYSKERPLLDLPKPLGLVGESVQTLPQETPDENIESRLVSFLHETLQLPEVGEVQVQLTIKQDGTISEVVVLSGESQKNKLYLQKYLPHLQLPMQFDQEKTWVVTFYNEI
jgi:hypothetical protein